MPPKPRITRGMILEAAYALAREKGVDAVNARSIAERLDCSTQPVLYQFARMEDLRREVYRMADEYHTACLMQPAGAEENPLLGMGLNYIRFAAQEKHLFRLLFQSDSFRGASLMTLTELPELEGVLGMFRQGTGLTMAQTKQVFRAVLLLVHGWASMLANNTMTYDEAEIIPLLGLAFDGMVSAMKMGGMQE
ncbi:MAG: TetR/AcrR family transcriptional regulator [Clostridia bacterium]|nr:TetR/AcrR family transcriptional regulator [Clostridia bacterium]